MISVKAVRRQNFIDHLIVPAILIIIAILYYQDIFNQWFIADDAGAVFTSSLPLRDILFMRNYSSIFYTPLVPLSFKPDVFLFGINPLAYHIHNTVILALVCFAVYKVLRLYAGRISSLLPAFIVLLSAPSLVCLLWITLRQYLYAMLFALIAVYLFLKYKPDFKSKPFIVLAILILCELSFIGKEQYMTLPFVLFILSEGSFKQRAASTYLYFILLAAHFLLRLYVLGGLGGYPGFVYSPVVYAETIYQSIFTESKVLFGYSGFVIFAALPLLSRPSKLLTAALIWPAALLISFFVMNHYPRLDTYRYWLIATVLFSFMIGLNASYIRNIPLKAAYCLIIAAFMIVHSVETHKDIKLFFAKESLKAKKVTELVVSGEYEDDLVLMPETERNWLVASGYPANIAKTYYKIEGIKPSSQSFFPLELLSIYPGIMAGKRVYEIRDGRVIDITGSVYEKINFFNSISSGEKPGLKLFIKDNSVEMDIMCTSAREIIGFDIRMSNGRPVAVNYITQYSQHINLTPFLNISDARIVPIEEFSYKNKKWHINESPIPADTTFLALMCVNTEGKYTRLSDIIAPK